MSKLFGLNYSDFCRVYCYQDIVERYPRLVKRLQIQFLISKDEAACCIRDYLLGLSISCEAISWCGRTPKEAILIAINNRYSQYL